MKKFLIIIVCLLFPAMQAIASGQCSDEVFFRRAHLTVTGALPWPKESAKFIDDKNPNKREKLVDKLLDSELALKYMQMHWGDILRVKSEFPSTCGQTVCRLTTVGFMSSSSTTYHTTRWCAICCSRRVVTSVRQR